MNTVHIREMHEEDVPDIAQVERMCFSMPWSETSFYSELYCRYSITRVAEVNNSIVGYICLRCIADEGQLLDLAVHKDYRKQGIATLLLKDAVEEVKSSGGRFLFLEVRVSNHESRKLYEKFGFRLSGTRKNYYINPVEDANLMMLEL